MAGSGGVVFFGGRRVCMVGLACALLASISVGARAAEHRFQLLLDTDNQASTGCSVPTVHGTASGIEQVWTTVVATSAGGANVVRIERQTCTGGVIGAAVIRDSGSWPAGVGHGTSGVAALETFIPRALLPPQGTMKVRVASTNATGGQDASGAFPVALAAIGPPSPPAQVREIPVSPWLAVALAMMLGAAGAGWLWRRPERSTLVLCVLVVAASGLVWAATVTLDGNVGDWNGVAPDTAAALGSGPIDAKVVAVFHQSDTANLYFRIDADVRADTVANQPPVVSAGPDQTITLPSIAALAGSASDDGLPNPPGALSLTWSTASGPGTVTFADAHAASTSASFSQAGSYVLRLTASDGVLSASGNVQITVNGGGANRKPVAQNDSSSSLGGASAQIDVLANDSDPDGNALTVSSFRQGAHGSVSCAPGGLCTYTPNAGFSGSDSFSYTVSDAHGGQANATATIAVTASDATVNAPALKKAVTSIVGRSAAFLYTGANPVQTGVTPGAISETRSAVLRGKVSTLGGADLSGVTVSILGHPEFGQTVTRSNGAYDLVVNGGGQLTVAYNASGFLAAHRQVDVPWQAYVPVPRVALIPVDAHVTAMTASAPIAQVHQAGRVVDRDGSRAIIIVVPAGTMATMSFANGSTQPLATMHVRATEYTVGADGPNAMPAQLPALSGYTYCVELSVDEAVAAGATHVTFNQPVVTYVENFLGFPVGTNVPVGFYERSTGQWIPSANGRVVKVVGTTSGLADVDTDGDGAADNGLGMSDDERRTLARSFTTGQSLWRSAVTHFSASDSNWGLSTPDDAVAPGNNGAGPDPDDPLQDPNCASGSIVECENRVLGESVPIVGTSYRLAYRSDRMPGLIAKRSIRLSGPSVPASLQSIGLHVSVAGRDFEQTFPAAGNQKATFVWDRKDAYGRTLLGGQTLNVRIDYNYPTTYQDPGPFPAAFNSVGVSLGLAAGRQALAVSQSFTTTIGEGLTDARTLGLGGWTLNIHHVYDPNGRVAHLGDGSRRRAGSLARTLSITTLTGQSQLFDITVGPDGSQFVALPHGDQIFRIAPDGSQSVVAGNGTEGFSGDSGPATLAELGDPTGVALGADGSLYIAEESNFRVRKVAPDGTITTVAGTGAAGFSGDGGPATRAQLSFAERVAVGADGTLYILDGQRVRRVNNDGIIQTVAGNGAVGGTGDGGPATAASLNASSISVAADGSLFIADFGNHRVRKVTPGGIINTVVDYATASGRPVSVRPATDGSLLIAVEFTTAQSPQIDRLRPDGTVVTIAGGGTSPLQTGVPATQVAVPALRAAALAPDGALYFVQGDASSNVVRVSPALPGFDGNAYFIASADGAELYVFDDEGRHLRTLNALTGATLFEFGYDANGLLDSITEKTGATDNVTTIRHDSNGNPVSIAGPFGQVTTLGVDANGFLGSIANPSGNTVNITSDGGGLMSTYADPLGNTSTFAFDSDGHLVRDADAAGVSQDLVHSVVGDVSTVTRTTTLGRTTTYATRNLDSNRQIRTLTAPDGTSTVMDESIDGGTLHVTISDGSSSDAQRGPDPRFGMQAPVDKSLTVRLPSALSHSASSALSASLAVASDPLSLVALHETFVTDGRTTTNTYDAAVRTMLTTTPAGRTVSRALDAQGRIVSTQFGDLAAITIAYDSRGRVASMTQGARQTRLSYNPQGFLDSITDPLGRTGRYGYDAAGRVTSKTFPDGRIATFTYDAAGNMTSLVPPGRTAHGFAYSNRNQLAAVTPPTLPGAGATSYSVDGDGQLSRVFAPDGRTMSITYDSSGRISARTQLDNGITADVQSFSYDAAGRLLRIASSSGETTTYAYDGPLPTGETWSGPISGSVTRAFDSSFRYASESVDGANTVNFSYDNDDLLIGAGSLAITRSARSGLPISASLDGVTTSIGYNEFGEPTSLVNSANAATLFANTYTRDALGRVISKSETIGGTTDAYAYTYGADGQLIAVTRNGSAIESYGYDANGNRTTATVNANAVSATYDAQDRLVQYGATAYAFDGAGGLAGRTVGGQTAAFHYDQLGNLLDATLADGTAIAYVVDGLGRRVGKKVNGTLVQRFLYADPLRVIAELDGANSVAARFIYADSTTPVAMVKGGTTFRIISDDVGSVRLVVDSITGAIAQRLDYDTFGNVARDTNPGFQPFGFGGGIYDRDTGLVRFGNRDYEPATGRWTAKDTIWFGGNDTNLYRYARNDPVNRNDPSGAAPPPVLEDKTDEIPIVQTLIEQDAIIDQKVLSQRAAEIRAKRIVPRSSRIDRADAKALAAAAEASARRPPRGFATTHVQVCAGVIAMAGIGMELFQDDIFRFLNRNGVVSDTGLRNFESFQELRAQSEAQFDNNPIAQSHPYLWIFMKGFIDSPPAAAMR